MVLVLSMDARRSLSREACCLARILMLLSTPMVGDDRSAASTRLSRSLRVGRGGDRRRRVGEGFPGVLSASVTSPMSDSMVPLPYMMGVVGVMGAAGKAWGIWEPCAA